MKKSERYYYKTCKTLPLYNFYEILNTKDLYWLVRGYDDEFSKEDLKDIDDTTLFQIWELIHTEYSGLFKGGSDDKKYLKVAQISEMEVEASTVRDLIDLLKVRNSEAIRNEIDAWGYFGDDIEKTEKKLKQLDFKISIFRSKNKDLIDPEKKDKVEEKVYDLFADIVAVESAFEGSQKIDPFKDTVSRWVNIILLAEKKQKNGVR